MSALNDLNQPRGEWDCGTTGIGVVVSDSLMFQRGEPTPSDPHLSHVYGLALPLLKRGMPITPVQLENVTVPHYLDAFHVLLLTYHGLKPLGSEVHPPLADWVKRGGALVVIDDDTDPYNRVREWWNNDGRSYATPREHLFEQLGFTGNQRAPEGKLINVGKGTVLWLRENPAMLASNPTGDERVVETTKQAAKRAGVRWRESNYLLLRRGPYVVAAGLEESTGSEPRILQGRFINLFDPKLRVRERISLLPASRYFLLDLEATYARETRLVASACKALPAKRDANSFSLVVEGVSNTPAVVLLSTSKAPRSVALAGLALQDFEYSSGERLLSQRSEAARTLSAFLIFVC